jgi:rhodanese-related sulfurtransferase
VKRWLAGAAALAGALAPFAGGADRKLVDTGAASIGDRAALAPFVGNAVGTDAARLAAETTVGDASHTAAETQAPAAATIDVAELARIVAAEEDHVSAVELAAWIHGKRPGLRVIDLRTTGEFAAFHIPGAEHISIEHLVTTPVGRDETIVLYSEVGIHGAQAWVFLRALGHRNVFFLRNGLHDWLDDVMSPTLAADASPEARAQFERVAELSRAFGGTPRQLTAPAVTTEASRRRGC